MHRMEQMQLKVSVHLVNSLFKGLIHVRGRGIEIRLSDRRKGNDLHRVPLLVFRFDQSAILHKSSSSERCIAAAQIVKLFLQVLELQVEAEEECHEI